MNNVLAVHMVPKKAQIAVGIKALLFLVSVLALLTGSTGCKSTYMQDVYIHNGTDATVLWNTGDDPRPDRAGRLGPGETARAPIPTPFDEKQLQQRNIKLLAWDTSKDLVFCHVYPVPELRDAGWKIELIRGDIRCGVDK